MGFRRHFLDPRNVRGHRWNHKREYRIYRELELNLRIKPRKRLKRDKPDALTVSDPLMRPYRIVVDSVYALIQHRQR